jgi:hypothetical protein
VELLVVLFLPVSPKGLRPRGALFSGLWSVLPTPLPVFSPGLRAGVLLFSTLTALKDNLVFFVILFFLFPPKADQPLAEINS